MLKRKILSLSSLIIIPAATLPVVSCAQESTVHFGYVQPITQEDINKFSDKWEGKQAILTSNEGNTRLEQTLSDKKPGESITESELGLNVDVFGLKPGMGFKMVVEQPYEVRYNAITKAPLPISILVRITFYSLGDRSIMASKVLTILPTEELNLSEAAKLFMSATSSKTADELRQTLGRKMQASAVELGYTEPDFVSLLPHQNKLPDGSYDPKLIYPELIRATYRFSMENSAAPARQSIRIIVKLSHGSSKVLHNTAYFILHAKP